MAGRYGRLDGVPSTSPGLTDSGFGRSSFAGGAGWSSGGLVVASMVSSRRSSLGRLKSRGWLCVKYPGSPLARSSHGFLHRKTTNVAATAAALRANRPPVSSRAALRTAIDRPLISSLVTFPRTVSPDGPPPCAPTQRRCSSPALPARRSVRSNVHHRSRHDALEDPERHQKAFARDVREWDLYKAFEYARCDNTGHREDRWSGGRGYDQRGCSGRSRIP
jgi:hypothetical protein